MYTCRCIRPGESPNARRHRATPADDRAWSLASHADGTNTLPLQAALELSLPQGLPNIAVCFLNAQRGNGVVASRDFKVGPVFCGTLLEAVDLSGAEHVSPLLSG